MKTKNKFTYLFTEINKRNANIAGGKGASLGEMTQVGIMVPPGFVVATQAFDEFLKVTDLNIELDSILDNVDHNAIHTIEEASQKIQTLITDAHMPQKIADEILKQYTKLGAEFVAVRSSATSEDSSEAAWAGQLDTYLNITEEKLLEYVKKCWASLFTSRAIFYRFEKRMHRDNISVAVIVQKMIQSEVSGVAFSVHPITEDYNQLIIEAGIGLGEAIVSGQITPDSYVVEKVPCRIIDKNIATQTRSLVRVATGIGNEWVNISQEESEKQKLSNKKILELTKLVLHVENHYGFPCDIEWAYEKDSFYITQSRPITTLKKKTLDINKTISSYSSTNETDQLYHLHFTQSEFGVLMLDILFGPNSYGALDYRSLTEQELSRVYLTRRGRKEAYELGKNLLDESFFKQLKVVPSV